MSAESSPRGFAPSEIGKFGERLAHAHLEAKGYRIIASNYRCRWGEVDLVAMDGATLVFVEVRTRRGDALVTPEESVTSEKTQRLALTAQDFMEHQAWASDDIHWRIDLVAIRLGAGGQVLEVRHLENVVEE